MLQPLSSSGQPKHQSRFAATNSMFQRQLSTTALNLGIASSTAGAASTGTTSRATSASGGPKLFQRQLTTSQLFSSSSSGANCQSLAAAAQDGGNKQRVANLLGASRCNPSSGLDNSTAAIAAAAAATNRPPIGRRLNDPANPSNHLQPDGGGGGGAEGGQQQKKAPKNKRIISRMLSISAIHTNVGGGGGSSTGQDASNLSGSHQQLNIGDGGAMGLSGADGSSSLMTTVGDQVPDKIDSSFTRSRSSSTSSGAPLDGQVGWGESILCLCFLDQGQATPNHNKSASSIGTANDAQVAAAAAGQAYQLALWLGTSQGRVLLVSLEMPDNEDNRILQLQSVNAESIPQAAIKLPGAILCLSSFVCEPNSSPTAPTLTTATTTSSAGSPSGPSAAATGGAAAHLASQSSSLDSDGLLQPPQLAGSAGGPGGSGGSGGPAGGPAALFMLLVSEKQARVYQVPPPGLSASSSSSPPQSGKQQSASGADHLQGQLQHGQGPRESTAASLADSPLARLLANKANCVGKTQLCDTSQALRSQPVQMRQAHLDELCLASYLATGDLVVHSLPKLALLQEGEFVPATSARISQSMCFSRNGHALYQPSPKEVAKFTLSAHYRAMVNEMTGLLYVPREMPEMPRTNFFKSLFSVTSSIGSKQSDRDELFGSDSGKASSRQVAKHIPSGAAREAAAGLDKLKGAVAGGMGHEMRLAREGLDERGEKLSEIEDRTLAMMNQSETYAQSAHQLAQKWKDKKWYQF